MKAVGQRGQPEVFATGEWMPIISECRVLTVLCGLSA
jgi:hypothetical protein